MRELPLDRPEVEPATLRAWSTHLGAKVSDPESVRHRLSAGSLPEAIAETARRRASHPALHIDGRTITHGELAVAAGRAASGIKALGGSVGTRVMLIAAVGLEEIAAYLGALRTGATVVLANPVLTPVELEDLAERSAVKWVFGSGTALTECQQISRGEIREIIGLRATDRETSSALLNDIGIGETMVRPLPPDSTAILAFTSGTTGRPKPTPLTHSNLLASIRGAMAAWRWSARDHLVHALPISHQHGLSGVHATLLAGSRATLLGKLDPERLLTTVVGGGATIHFGVPAIHQRLLDDLGERASGLARLRLAISGSGPLPIDLASRYHEMVGTSLFERYGTTESGLDVSNPYHGPAAAGQVGLPLPGVEVALLDDDRNPLTGPGPGEIALRGPQVFGGYLNLPDSAQPFVGKWFTTGDLGAVDPDTGYLHIVGRTKDVIISGGMNVYPREVEDVILAVDQVEDVAVIGLESSRWGEEVVAVVSPSGIDTGVIMNAVTESLAGYKRPKRVIAVEKIPRTQVGKLDQRLLRKMIPPSGSMESAGGIGSPQQTRARRERWS